MSTATAFPQSPKRPLTIEDLPDAIGDTPGELVRGRYIPMSPTGGQHAEVEANIAHELRSFIKGRGIGKVMCGEVGIVIQRNPDTVRGADVAFISQERSQNASPVGYLDVAPELIVEVVSPNDRWTEISEKLEEYFSVGALTVWVVNPKHRQVLVYRSPTEAQMHGPDDVLSGGTVLPGFEIKVGVLFSG